VLVLPAPARSSVRSAVRRGTADSHDHLCARAREPRTAHDRDAGGPDYHRTPAEARGLLGAGSLTRENPVALAAEDLVATACAVVAPPPTSGPEGPRPGGAGRLWEDSGVAHERIERLAASPAMSPEALRALYRFAFTRRSLPALLILARNPRLPDDVDAELAHHPEERLRAAWLARPQRTAADLAPYIAEASSSTEVAALVGRTDLTADDYRSLEPRVRAQTTAWPLLLNETAPFASRQHAAEVLGRRFPVLSAPVEARLDVFVAPEPALVRTLAHTTRSLPALGYLARHPDLGPDAAERVAATAAGAYPPTDDHPDTDLAVCKVLAALADNPTADDALREWCRDRVQKWGRKHLLGRLAPMGLPTTASASEVSALVDQLAADVRRRHWRTEESRRALRRLAARRDCPPDVLRRAVSRLGHKDARLLATRHAPRPELHAVIVECRPEAVPFRARVIPPDERDAAAAYPVSALTPRGRREVPPAVAAYLSAGLGGTPDRWALLDQVATGFDGPLEDLVALLYAAT